MYKKIIFLGLFLTCIGKLKSQVVYVDPNLIRGDISFTQMNLKFDGIPVRKAIGLHTKVGGRIISGFMSAKNKICVRDEFFLDLTLGKLTSTPLTYFNESESKFSTAGMFGYEFLVGYRTEKYAAMGGVKLQWTNIFIGSSEFVGDKLFISSSSLMLRGEYRIGDAEEFRIVFMGWSNFNSEKNNSGFNFDFPISKKRRLWLTFQYQAMSYINSAPANFDNGKYINGSFNQWFAGIKVGSIY
ncbi:MAG: hypothetical protein ABI199_01535 [Bacteroidia bacterium]